MGTNFYLKDHEHTYIGKRSAAGLYCYGCGISLTQASKLNYSTSTDKHGRRVDTFYGQDAIHYSPFMGLGGVFACCPLCGSLPVEEALSASAGGRELGFNTTPPTRKDGVRTCASFTFAWYPEVFREEVLRFGVVDEYDREYTGEEFLRMVALDCPVRYWDSVGTEFS